YRLGYPLFTQPLSLDLDRAPADVGADPALVDDAYVLRTTQATSRIANLSAFAAHNDIGAERQGRASKAQAQCIADVVSKEHSSSASKGLAPDTIQGRVIEPVYLAA